MALSQAVIDAVIDYSWADIAKMAKAAMLALTVSQSTSMMGHTLLRTDMDSLKKLYDMAVAQTNALADTGGDIALVRYGERV